jgi:type IX secretion system substrate protein
VPDCMGDSTKMDLSLGYFTFADGETGAWIGSESVCALDVPIKFSFKAKCGRITTHDKEYLPPLCTEDTFQYQVEESGISRWEWNISPYWAVPYVTNTGDNGFTIEAPLDNNTDQPVDVTGILIGYAEDGSNDKVIRQFTFTLKDSETCETVSTESAGGLKENSQQLRVYPVPANESIILEWSFILQKDAKVNIYNAHGILQESITVSPTDLNQKRISTENLASGIYYISLGNGDFRYVTRMVKM